MLRLSAIIPPPNIPLQAISIKYTISLSFPDHSLEMIYSFRKSGEKACKLTERLQILRLSIFEVTKSFQPLKQILENLEE